MNIVVRFLGGSEYWQAKVLKSAADASRIMSDEKFLALVEKEPFFDFTSDTPKAVADKIRNAGDVAIKVGFYCKFFTKAIAYEDDGGAYFNTRKEKYGAGGLNNVTHELLHALGYSHNGNSPFGQAFTVPWRVAALANSSLSRR